MSEDRGPRRGNSDQRPRGPRNRAGRPEERSANARQRTGKGRERAGEPRQRASGSRERAGYRPGQDARPIEPEVDDDVTAAMLDPAARRRLRTLSRLNAEHVARHLVMAGRQIDVDPQRAYDHARVAVRHAGRVDVVREAMALAAYATARYGEAIREIRALRRLSGRQELRAVEADCERGLGRPERALAIVAETPPAELAPAEWVELQIVASGARADLGEHETGLLIVDEALHRVRETQLRHRLLSVRADRLEELGREAEAAEIRRQLPPLELTDDEDTVIVADLEAE